MRKLIAILLCFLSLNGFASVSGDLGTFFGSLGFDGNITSGSAYQGQAGGYYSGGSFYLRNQVKNLQIMHIDAPSFRSGCGGIDLFMGGFSFIDAKQLVAFFQKIMSNAAGYALNLALETEVPEIAHAMQYLQQIAQKINDANVNSCEMAEDLVGGLWPKNRASQQQICQDIGSQHNEFSDWAAARQECGSGTAFPDKINEASKDPNYKDKVTVNKNLVWDAILKNGFLTGDHELAEFFMSLSGTVTYDDKGSATVYYPLTNNRDIIKAILTGGSAQIYVCDEVEKCLKPHLSEINIRKEDGLNQRVVKIINELVDNVQNDAPITNIQKGFLNSITIPVLKMITVSLSLGAGAQALDLANYSDVVAKDLLKQYMFEILQIVGQSVTGSTDYTPVVQQQLKDQIQKALADVENMKTSSHQDIQDVMSLVQNARTLEQEATAKMSDQMKDNLNFKGDGS